MLVCWQKLRKASVWMYVGFTVFFLCIFTTIGPTIPSYFIQRTYRDNLQDQAVKVKFGTTTTGRILRDRRKALMMYCKGKELTNPGNNTQRILSSHFVYDKDRRFVYCAAEKIGSTFWRRLFQIIAGKSNKTSPFDIASGSALHGHVNTFQFQTFDFVHALLQQSTKFVISRDPYSRLFSAYANKLFQVNPVFWPNYGKMVLKHSQRNISKEDLDCGRGITFPDLVKYVIYSESVGNYRDGHFIPLADHCRPCQIKYDIIAKMETIKGDTLFVLDHLGMGHMERLTQSIKDMDSGSEVDSITSTSSQVIAFLNSYVKCISRAEGLRRTWRSFQYRGLIGKDVKYPLTVAEEGKIDHYGLTDVLSKAMKESRTREERLLNRQLVLEEAYSLVSKDDLFKLSEIFKHDCGAFGYDCYPDYVFKKTDKPKSNFLDIWSA